MTKPSLDSAHAELGKFVEAFELMVQALRYGCTIILSSPAPKWQPLIRIPFHHSSMTAKPLIDIFTAILGTILSDEDTIKALKLDNAELATFKGVLAQVRTDCEKLASKRNNLLHGTWFIGLNPDPLDLSKFFVAKSVTTRSGLKSVDSLPRNIEEIKALTKECLRLRDWIHLLHSTWGFRNDPKITTLFKFSAETERWEDQRKSLST